VSRLVAPSPDDRQLWRQLLARLRANRRGDHTLFVWRPKTSLFVIANAID